MSVSIFCYCVSAVWKIAAMFFNTFFTIKILDRSCHASNSMIVFNLLEHFPIYLIVIEMVTDFF